MKLRREDPVLIFGAGRYGRDVASILEAEGYPVQGFLQSEPASLVVDGKRVWTWRELTDRERPWQVVVGIFNRETPYDGLASLLREHGFHSIQFPWETYAQFGTFLGWRYWLESPAYLDAHDQEIQTTIDRMADEESRQIVRRMVDFRCGRDLAFSSFVSPEPQYFNKLTLPALIGRPVIYVDGGAYDGDTFRALRSQVDLRRAYLFEPDPGNFARLTSGIAVERSEVVCLPMALADRLSQVAGRRRRWWLGARQRSSRSGWMTCCPRSGSIFSSSMLKGPKMRPYEERRPCWRVHAPCWRSVSTIAPTISGDYRRWSPPSVPDIDSTFDSTCSTPLTRSFTRSRRFDGVPPLSWTLHLAR